MNKFNKRQHHEIGDWYDQTTKKKKREESQSSKRVAIALRPFKLKELSKILETNSQKEVINPV